MLHWSPDQFWNATVYDLVRSIKGHMAAHGIKDKSKSPITPEKARELKDLIAREQEKDRIRNAQIG